jgi:flagellar FliJ protein
VKRFHFRLERLLELRAHREREWLARLAEAAGHCVRVQRGLQDNESATGAGFRSVSLQEPWSGDTRVDLSLLIYREQYLNRLGVERRLLERELQERLARKDEVQAKYLEHSRDRKILDRLKERREREFYREQRKEEFKAMDDANGSRYLRGKLPGAP